MAARDVIAGATVALALTAIISGRADAADSNACEIAGSWNATYMWDGGGSRGTIAFTIHGNLFVGRAIGDETAPAGAETIRGKFEAGKIRAVAVFHSRRGWVPASSSIDDTCSMITFELPDARVTLKR